MDYLFISFIVAVFIAVVLLTEGLYSSWNAKRGQQAKRMAQRLRSVSAHSGAGDKETSILKERLLSKSPAIHRLLLRIPRALQVDRLLEQAGVGFDLSRFVAASALCSAAAGLPLMMTRVPMLLALAAAILAGFLPTLYVLRKKRLRINRITEQLPDALDLMSRAMRAGHAFPVALQMVSDEMLQPIAGEFRIVSDEVNYGISMSEALKNLSARLPGTDIGYFVVAVLIQRETGGNLTELLGNIASIIRARFKLFGQIRVLSAEGRLSAWILGLLPFAMAAVILVINPRFMKVLWTDPVGLQMIGAMLLMMLAGFFWMRKIIRIRV